MQRAFAYRTEQRKRSENQDSYGVFEFDDYVLAIVCDGMGGHVGGAQASALAVRTIHESMSKATGMEPGPALQRALESANQVIYEAARKNHRLMGMGTTAVAAIVANDGFVHIAHVGDSRAYLINGGEAVQVTRDHTMVNLFVDAELLTPEDAATHPEAHVLSRSLGVERQVEVELSAPIELADDDVVFLCSDGVHGVVTDWELGSVDWANASPAIDHVLDIVEAREGDDNATAVAVRIGDGISMGASQIPVLKPIEESLGHGKRATIVPDDVQFIDEQAHDIAGIESAVTVKHDIAPPQMLYADDTSEPESDIAAEISAVLPTAKSDPTQDTALTAPTVRVDPTPGPIQRRKGPEEEAPKASSKPSKASKNNRMLAGLALVVVLAIGALGAGYIGTRSAETGGTTIIANHGHTEPLLDPEPTEPVDANTYVFEVVLPDAPRRLPHRPTRYTQPPPGGQAQFAAVQAARDRMCADSLNAVWKAMKISPDYAQLYNQAWFCFQTTHSSKLATAKIAEPERFGDLEIHFRGWPAPGEPEIQWTPIAKEMPSWYRPALGGIEYRLEAWAQSTNSDRMTKVMTDLKGEPSVTDQLADDLWIEASAAKALSEIEEPSEENLEAWARRVYVVTSQMNGRLGALMRTNRPELVPQIEAMLQAATEGEELPEQITIAMGVGAGEMEVPKIVKKVRPATGPKKPVDPASKEPDLNEGTDNGTSGGIIHR